jgi:hypothetical protein
MILLRDRAEELHLPLSGQAFDEFLVLQGWLQDFHLQNPGADEWKCPWGITKLVNIIYLRLIISRWPLNSLGFGRANV